MELGLHLDHDWFPRPLPWNVQIGERSWCYSSYCCLHHRSQQPGSVRIGHDSGVYHGSFFELGPDAVVEIGDFCTLVGAIIATNGRVLIGNYSFLAHRVVLADSFAAVPPERTPRPTNSRIEPLNPDMGPESWNPPLPSFGHPLLQPLEERARGEEAAGFMESEDGAGGSFAAGSAAPPLSIPSIVIGENVWIGAHAIVLGGAEIGEGSIVGAAAVVDVKVPPYSLVVGNPARVRPLAKPGA